MRGRSGGLGALDGRLPLAELEPCPFQQLTPWSSGYLEKFSLHSKGPPKVLEVGRVLWLCAELSVDAFCERFESGGLSFEASQIFGIFGSREEGMRASAERRGACVCRVYGIDVQKYPRDRLSMRKRQSSEVGRCDSATQDH